MRDGNKTPIDNKTIWANITHEMKTPLNGIIGMNELLQKSKLNNEQEQYVNIIDECSKQLLEMVNSFLDHNKLINNETVLEFKPINLRRCIEESYNTILLKADEKKINISFSIDENVPKYIITDKKKLKQILINLLINAVKFTYDGEIKTTVTSKIINDNKYNIYFSVKDTGVGIPQHEINNIFNSFYKLNNHSEGMGLGLSISKYLIKMLNGNIQVNSLMNNGSTFTFNIIVNKYNKQNNNKKYKIIKDKKVLLICEEEYINYYINEFNNIKMIPVIYKTDDIDMIFIDISRNTLLINNKILEASKIITEINKEYNNIPIMVATSISNLSNININYKIIKPINQDKLINMCNNIIKETNQLSINNLNIIYNNKKIL